MEPLSRVLETGTKELSHGSMRNSIMSDKGKGLQHDDISGIGCDPHAYSRSVQGFHSDGSFGAVTRFQPLIDKQAAASERTHVREPAKKGF